MRFSFLFHRIVAWMLIWLMVTSPVSPLWAQEHMESQESLNFSEMTAGVAAPLIEEGKKNSLKVRNAPVSSSGAYIKSIPIALPPGRLGMTPSLALSYSSADSKKDSYVGAGWDLSIGSISRSTLKGFPQLKKIDTESILEKSFRYDDTAGAFISPSGLLSPAGNALCPLGEEGNNGKFFVPMREHSPVRYEYLSTGRGKWIEYLPSGVKKYFGADPDGREARIVNELGTHAWLLLMAEDVDGNTIRYSYHNIQQQDRTDLQKPQSVPILSKIEWGGNRKLETSHFFKVLIESSEHSGGLDMKNGHVLLNNKIDSITVKGPENEEYWQYIFEYNLSPDTGRLLLVSLTRKAPEKAPDRQPWVSLRKVTFEYTTNNSLVNDSRTLSLFPPVGMELPDNLGEAGVYSGMERRGLLNLDAVEASLRDYLSDYIMSPPGYREGFKFLDFDGDGDTDIIYHPAGLVVTASRILYGLSFKQEDRQSCPSQTTEDDPWCWRPMGNPDILGYNPDTYLTQLGDIDGDFRIDGLYIPYRIEERFGGGSLGDSGWSPSLDYCTSDAFWNRCGDIDPVPDPSRFNQFLEDIGGRPHVSGGRGDPFDPLVVGGSITNPERPDGPPRLVLVFPPKDLVPEARKLPLLWSGSQVTKGGKNLHKSKKSKLNFPEIHAGYLHVGPNGKPVLTPLRQAGVGKLDYERPQYLGTQQRPSSKAAVSPPDFSKSPQRRGSSLMGGSPKSSRSDLPDVSSPADCMSMIEYCYELIQSVVDSGPYFDSEPPCDQRFFTDNPLCPGHDNYVGPDLAGTYEDFDDDCIVVSGSDFPIAVVKQNPPTVEERILKNWPRVAVPKISMVGTETIGTVGISGDADVIIESDILAPLVDINGDGHSDIVLLKWLRRDGWRIVDSFFLPRVYIERDSNFELDAPVEGSSTTSAFTRSLSRIVHKDGSCGLCVSERCKFTNRINFNSFFMDVNSDGLMDLVVARAPRKNGAGPEQPLCIPGHQVYLNRGYMWDADALEGETWSSKVQDFYSSTDYLSSPLLLLKNHQGQCSGIGFQDEENCLQVSMSSMSIADMNADGRQDIIFAYRRPPSRQNVSNVFLNNGRGFEVSSITYPIPASFAPERGCDVQAGGTRPMTDTARMVDLDSDGLVDVIVPGEEIGDPAIQSSRPPKWYRNKGKIPDLLKSVKNEAGATDLIEYVAATSINAQNVVFDVGSLPPGHTVVKKVTRSAVPKGSWRYAVETISLQYKNFVRNSTGSEAIGFEEVKATFQNGLPNGFWIPRTQNLEVIRIFNVQHKVPNIPVEFPLKGTIEEVTSKSGGFSTKTRYDYDLSLLGEKAVRVRRSLTQEAEFVNQSARWMCSETQFFDEFGNHVKILSGNCNGSGPVIEDNERVIKQYTYQNVTSQQWRIGLPTLETSCGYKALIAESELVNALLSYKEWIYDESGHMIKELVAKNQSELIDCSDSENITIESEKYYDYDEYGLVTALKSNHNLSGLGNVSFKEYDPYKLYPAKITIDYTHFVDGTAQDPTTITEQYGNDPRSGEVIHHVDVNGKEHKVFLDSFARPLLEVGPQQTVLSINSYFDSYPVRVQNHIFVDQDKFFTRITQMDSTGNILAIVEGAENCETVRRKFEVFDSFGRGFISYLPAFVEQYDVIEAPIEDTLKKTTVFDGFNRPVLITEPDSRQRKYEYGPWFSTETNPRGFKTSTFLDWRGEVKSITKYESNGNSVAAEKTFVRDGLGRIIRLIDADRNMRQFEYDLGGRMCRVTLPHKPRAGSPAVVQLEYDLNDRLSAIKNPSGREANLERDELMRLVQIVANDMNGGRVESFLEYDKAEDQAAGRLWKVHDRTGVTYYSYDSFGRYKNISYQPSEQVRDNSEVLGEKYVSEFEYARRGHLRNVHFLGIGYESKVGIEYERDNMGRAVKVLSTSNNSAIPIVQNIVYDAFESIIHQDLGNGGRIEWKYDSLMHWLKQIDLLDSNGSIWGSVAYKYDKNSNVIKERRKTENDSVLSTKEYRYDTLDRLSYSKIVAPGYSLEDKEIIYSPGGNINSVVRPGDAAAAGYHTEKYYYNLPLHAQAVTSINMDRAGEVQIDYDQDGRLISKVVTDPLTEHNILYKNQYDAAGCLVESTKSMREDGPPSVRITNIYNSERRRVFRKYDVEGSVKRVIDFAGLAEIRPDESEFLIRVPIHGLTTVEDSRSLVDGSRQLERSAYIHSDLRGSILAEAPFQAPATIRRGEAEYTAWGRVIRLSNLPVPEHGFLDEEPYPSLGFYHFGLRVYDPQLRRFMSPDPLILALPGSDEIPDLETNLYAYAGNNPVRLIDKTGAVPMDAPITYGIDNPDERREYRNAFIQTIEQSPVLKTVVSSHPLVATIDTIETLVNWNKLSKFEKAIFLASIGVAVVSRTGPVKPKIRAPSTPTSGSSASSLIGISRAKSVNLPSWKKVQIDIDHIASGHMKGGSRVSPSKDLFPDTMSKSQVRKAVREAYRGGKKVETQGERVRVRGESGGLKIEMWVNKETKTIETAYPVRN